MIPVPAVAFIFHAAAQVRRQQLYGVEIDGQLPQHLRADARVPFLGFSGPKFRPGCPVLLAINPGGGGDAYQVRTPQDEELIPLIEAFVAAEDIEIEAAFNRMTRTYMAMAQTWNLRRILKPTLDACGVSVEEVCYLNIFPYRTRGDVRPSASSLRKAWSDITSPLLADLKPSKLIALGKKAGGVAQSLAKEGPRLYVVPRTIGDTYISDEAKLVLQQIRSAT